MSINNLVKINSEDYEIDERQTYNFNKQRIDKVEKILKNSGVTSITNFYDPSNLNIVHHVNQALKANLYLKRTRTI